MGIEPTLRFLPSREAPVQLELRGLHVHSRHPEREAKRHALALVAARPGVVLCFAPGLAYLVEALLRYTDVAVAWIEENDEIREAALERITPALGDLSLREVPAPLNHRCWTSAQSNRLFLFSRTPSLEDLRQVFGTAIDSSAISTIRSTLQPSYLTLIHQLERLAFRHAVNRNTLHRFDRLWVKNAYYNFRHAHHFEPVRMLFERFSGVPAVIAAAGPSLDQTLPMLREFRNRFLLLAVDTALGPLNHAGIDPDFALSVDAQAANFLHARNYRGKARWIIDPTVSYLLLRQIKGSRPSQGTNQGIFVFENPLPVVTGLFNMIGPHAPGMLHSGGSVSTNAYDLALKMGCNPIYLCGLDLSFPGLRIHARGSALEEAFHSRTSRLHGIQHLNYRQLTAIDRRYTPDCEGAPVATNDKLNVFFQWFESQFRRMPDSRVVKNVYGGGVCFSHVESIPVASFTAELRALEPLPEIPIPRAGNPGPEQEDQPTTSLSDDAARNPSETARRTDHLRKRLRGTMRILEALDPGTDKSTAELEQAAKALLGDYSDIVRILSNGMQEALLSLSPTRHGPADMQKGQDLSAFLRELRHACALHLLMLKE